MRITAGTIIAILFTVCLIDWAGPPSSAGSQDLLVAAASDLSFAMKEILAKFERETGQRVTLSLGSSGNLFSQLSHGAPFDVYFSADIRYPRRLIEQGLALPDSLVVYAIGHLVLWVPQGSPIDVQRLGMAALLHPAARKIAIANWRHAPYGQAAMAALEHFDLERAVAARLVLGENISQTAQFVQSGNADIGLIALSLAMAPAMREAGTYWDVPQNAYPRLEQAAVITTMAARHSHLDAARTLLAWVAGDEGRAILEAYGFVVPERTGGADGDVD